MTRGRAGKNLSALLIVAALLSGCASLGTTRSDVDLADPEASRETRALFANLQRLASDHVLFGHEDALAYGVHWIGEEDRSDVKDVTGSYPAVYGWELGDLELGAEENLDGVDFEDMQRWIKKGYERGGVITVAWHMNNPVSGGNAWDTTRAVYSILPGGENHETYKVWLDRFAEFVGGLKTGPFTWLGFGQPVPIIFRPFHEHTGSWFWWGSDHATSEEYVTLWRFTVDYLREGKGLHNLLYAYSTDVFDSEADYLARYPGDDYVDLLGYDDYQALRSDLTAPMMTDRLRMLVTMAEARGKLAALTETGLEAVPDSTWWTGRLLGAIEADPVARRIAYVLVWRNANAEVRAAEGKSPTHFYAPYLDHPSAPDFVRFYEDPFVLFGDELPDLYD
jgi:mannan endo-1,4-beta-mannosidase